MFLKSAKVWLRFRLWLHLGRPCKAWAAHLDEIEDEWVALGHRPFWP